MIKKYLLPVLLLISVSFANAQQKLNNNLFQKKLANGLTILVVEDHTVPLVSLMMTFKAGAFTENAEENGLTGIYQSMLEQGNKDFESGQDRNYYAGQLGLRLGNSVTSTEYTSTYFTLPTSKFSEGLSFLNSEIRFAKLDPAELESEKQVMNSELNRKESDPYYQLNDVMDHHLWGDLISRKKPIGNHQNINEATTDAMRIVKSKYFYPDNAVLIIGGDIDHQTAFDQAEKMYGDWAPAGFDPFKKWPVPEFAPLAKPDYFIVESKLATAPSISIYWHGPDTRNDVNATYAADVFSYIINQNASKLNKALVRSGLASAIRFGYLTCKYTGPISLTVVPNPAKVKECIEEIKRQLSLLDSDDYLTPEQIATAKRQLEITKVREEDITTTFIHTLSFWWTAASINYYLGYNDNLQKVTKAGIQNYVRKYIKNQPYCAGLLISPDLRTQINADDFFVAAN